MRFRCGLTLRVTLRPKSLAICGRGWKATKSPAGRHPTLTSDFASLLDASKFRSVVFQLSTMRSRLHGLTQQVDVGEEELLALSSWAPSAANQLDGSRNVKARRYAMQQLFALCHGCWSAQIWVVAASCIGERHGCCSAWPRCRSVLLHVSRHDSLIILDFSVGERMA